MYKKFLWRHHLHPTSMTLLFYTSRFFLTSCVGLILHSTTVLTASQSTFEGTMRVLCNYCSVPSKLFAFGPVWRFLFKIGQVPRPDQQISYVFLYFFSQNLLGQIDKLLSQSLRTIWPWQEHWATACGLAFHPFVTVALEYPHSTLKDTTTCSCHSGTLQYEIYIAGQWNLGV